MIGARSIASCWTMVSVRGLDKSVESVDIALTFIVQGLGPFVYSHLRRSLGIMRQKMFISMIVSCRAKSKGSKSGIVGFVPPILQFSKAFLVKF